MAHNAAQRRSNPFARGSSPSPTTNAISNIPKSMLVSSPLASDQIALHTRTQSFSPQPSGLVSSNISVNHTRSNSKSSGPLSNTFAQTFINTEEMQRELPTVKGIEGENDFSGKRYVWLKDPVVAFVKGWVVEELGNHQVVVQCEDGSVRNTFHDSRRLLMHYSNEK